MRARAHEFATFRLKCHEVDYLTTTDHSATSSERLRPTAFWLASERAPHRGHIMAEASRAETVMVNECCCTATMQYKNLNILQSAFSRLTLTLRTD